MWYVVVAPGERLVSMSYFPEEVRNILAVTGHRKISLWRNWPMKKRPVDIGIWGHPVKRLVPVWHLNAKLINLAEVH